jgi:hypothetical protein
MAKENDSNTSDRNKVLIDLLKHLSTLSVLVIVLMFAFLQNVYIDPGLGLFVGVALIGFLVSAVTCVTFFTLVAFSAYDPDSELASLKNRMSVGVMIGAWGGFLLGVLGLAAFTILRLMQSSVVY